MSEGTPEPPPDFDLAEPYSVDPRKLVRDGDDRVGEFVLCLAMAFNDLKGAYYCHEQLLRYRAHADRRPLAHRGQLSAMNDQVARLLIGIVHEVLNVIRKGVRVFEDPEFQSLRSALPKSSQTAWREIRQVAENEDRVPQRHDATSQLLVKLRNHVSFHYDGPKLVEGYLLHFKLDAVQEHEQHAFISDGKNMEGTRFYFADAAMVQATTAATKLERADVHRQISDLAQMLADTLRDVVLAFVQARAPSVEGRAASAQRARTTHERHGHRRARKGRKR